jgi:hypothetical protein
MIASTGYAWRKKKHIAAIHTSVTIILGLVAALTPLAAGRPAVGGKPAVKLLRWAYIASPTVHVARQPVGRDYEGRPGDAQRLAVGPGERKAGSLPLGREGKRRTGSDDADFGLDPAARLAGLHLLDRWQARGRNVNETVKIWGLASGSSCTKSRAAAFIPTFRFVDERQSWANRTAAW